jgi:hypothetical protein
MSIRELINNKSIELLQNSKITISGELNILTNDILQSIIMDDDLYDRATSYAQELRNKYPYMKIEVIKELHEITVKIFALNKLFNYQNFLDDLKGNLSKLVTSLLETDGINVKLNVNGNIRNWDKIEKFMLVNNKDVISYKITETIQLNEISKNVGKFVDKICCKSQVVS